MKRPLKNVQLRLDQTTFELLKAYKDQCGLANLSEAIEKLVFYNLPLQEDKTDLTIEQDVPAPEDKTVIVRTTDQTFESNDVLQVRDDVPIPHIHNGNRESFSTVVENTLKKMKVGHSFLVKGENQRSISLGVGKKLKMTLATRQTPDFKKDKSIRVWRVA